jgi:Xaa-Pro dipeptidase
MKFSFNELDVSKKRIELAKQALTDSEMDAMIFFDSDRYGRKFALTVAYTALVLFPDEDPILIAHSIEKDHAESESPLEIVEIKDTDKLKDSLKLLLARKKNGKRKVAVVLWNAKFERVEALRELNSEITDASEEVLPHCLRKPFPEEIDAIKKLSQICDKGLEAAFNVIEPGLLENEVAAEVDYAVERSGATEHAFPTLVASGYRAAFPHGWTSHKKINEGDAVVVDIGPILAGYDGCVCRAFIAGDSLQWKKEIEAVREAIHESLEILKNQKTASAAQIDKIARQVIKKHGYAAWPNMKTVWTGHPIGGFVSPTITSYSRDEIEENMVFTVEPGIYIKGKGGVRIEHHILAKKHNYEILDKFPESPW